MTIAHWTLLLAAACALLTAAVLILLLRRGGGDGAGDPKNLLLLGQSVAETRNNVNRAMETVNQKTEQLTRQTYETRLQVTRSIAELQEKMSASDKESAAAVAEAVRQMQASNEKKLDEMRATVDEKLSGTLNERLDASFQTVSDQLSKVYRSLGEMQEMSGGITALNRVLSGVKTRGNWAETQLESLLDQIIPGMYVKNYAPGGGSEVVEFAVRIPSPEGDAPVYMPVDSKFPMEDYLRLCSASDAGDADGMQAARKSLENRILNEAKAVRKYICPPETTPFAVLYLATDSLYAEVMASKANLADRVHTDYRVMLAGPSTITALLSSLAMGFRSVALNQKADEVMKLLGAAKAQYEKFEEVLAAAQKSIDAAGKKLEEAQNRNRIIRKNLKNVESLDEAAGGNLLTE